MINKLQKLDIRIPQWDMNDLVDRDCPVCNSKNSNSLYERPDGLNVKFCSICNMYFVSPSPSDSQLRIFYSTYDQKHRRISDVSPEKLAESYAKADCFSDFRVCELSSILEFKGAHVLDVGFGRAFFLYCMKKLGAIPYGLELDPKAVSFAKHLGIENVYEKNIEDFDVQLKFDLITLFDSIEHPLNPLCFLEKAATMLKSGGFLAIWTPNGDFSHLQDSPVTFRVDLEHMQYFTPGSCLFIAEKLKLHIVHLESIGFPGLENIDKPMPISSTKLKKRIFKQVVNAIPGYSSFRKFRNELKRRLFSADKVDQRSGSYHLFCIFQKI